MANTKNAKLTIITPTLNCAQTIKDTINSTSNLRRSIATHLIVDSGSSDGTVSISVSDGLEVKYYPPGNMYAAINYGISLCDSEWVTYINGDDILFSESMMASLASDNDVDVIYGNIDYIDGEGRFLFPWSSAPKVDFKALFFAGVMPFPQPGTFFRKSLWEKLGGFNEEFKFSSDFDFFLRAYMAEAKFLHYDRYTSAAFRLHKMQISNLHKEAMFLESRKAIIQSGLRVGVIRRMWSLSRMRIRNIRNYLIRYLRRLELE